MNRIIKNTWEGVCDVMNIFVMAQFPKRYALKKFKG